MLHYLNLIYSFLVIVYSLQWYNINSIIKLFQTIFLIGLYIFTNLGS